MKPSVRLVKFAAVGGGCLALQFLFLLFLLTLLHPFFSAVIAFLVSAQLNFFLNQRFTWADRTSPHSLATRWATFNASAVTSVLVVNGFAFWALLTVGVQHWLALLIATCASTGFTFVMNHFVVFRSAKGAEVPDPVATLVPQTGTLLGPQAA